MDSKWKSRKFIGFVIITGLMTIVLITNVVLFAIDNSVELVFDVFLPSLAGIYATYAAANGWEHSSNNNGNGKVEK